MSGLGLLAHLLHLPPPAHPALRPAYPQVYVLGKKEGAEAAVRVAYDDVTESMAHPEVGTAKSVCVYYF